MTNNNTSNVILDDEFGNKIGVVRKTDLDYELLQITINKGREIPRRIAGWSWIKRINANISDWTGNNSKNRVEIQIKALKPNKYTKNTTETFLIEEHTYWEIFEHLKDTRIPNDKLIDIAKSLYRNVILVPNDCAEEVVENRTEIYGIVGNGDLMLPSKHILTNEEKYHINYEYQDFMNVFEKEVPDIQKISKGITLLHKYVKDDKYSKTVLAYTMIASFRLFLMHTFNVPEFPYLLLTSISSDKAKSARCKLIINNIMLGSIRKASSGSKDLAGSLVKIQDKQFITANLYFEEMGNLETNFTSLKDLATDTLYQDTKGDRSGKKAFHQTILRGAITMSNNNTDWYKIPKPLLDRFIILNLEDAEKTYDKVETDYKILKKNAYKLTRYIWESLPRYKELLIEEDVERDNVKEYILRNGMKIVNALFNDFNLEPVTLDIEDVLNNVEDIVTTDKDFLKSKLLNEIRRETNVRSHNIFSIPAIASGIDSDDIDLTTTFKSIIVKAASLGLYVNDEGILITAKFLKYLQDKYASQFKAIKTIPKLKQHCFTQEDSVFYIHPKNGDLSKMNKYYIKGNYTLSDINKVRYGLFIEFNKEYTNEE